MTFGDKIRKLRIEKKMTQQKLGAMVGVSYLMDDNETVCLGNDEPSEYSGAKQARQILEQTAALFASGTMTNEDKTIFMDEMTRLYLESKKNRRKW